MLSIVSRRAWTATRLLTQQKAPTHHATRGFSTAGKDNDKGNGKPVEDDEADDMENDEEFGLADFDIDIDEDEELEPQLNQIADEGKNLTPELASELVAKMVESTTKSLGDTSPSKEDILPAITPHTISVLKASRITTNTIKSAASDLYVLPITRKVSAKLNLRSLNLSAPAEEALKIIAGPRVRNDEIWFSSQKYPSVEENRANIISKLDRLVFAAKTSVGETVNTTPLEGWDQVEREVETQAAEEIAEAGSISSVVGG